MLRKGHGDVEISQQRKREGKMLRVERDNIEFTDPRFERGKSWNSGIEKEGKTFHKLQAFGMNDDLWDRVGGKGSESPDDASENPFEKLPENSEHTESFLLRWLFVPWFDIIRDSGSAHDALSVNISPYYLYRGYHL